jgi:hypothetical protein
MLGSTPSNLSSSPISAPPAKKQKTLDSPSDILSQNKRVRDLADERENFCCVLTGHPSREITHIYPRHLIKHKEEDKFGQRHDFWNHLKSFWSQEKVAAWEAELFPQGICETGLETVYNLITLSRGAHEMWGRGAFALKPIFVSDNKMTLEVQFFWQKKQTDSQTMSLLTTPFSTEGLDQNEGAYDHGQRADLMNSRTRQCIKSGEYFKIQTDDPSTKPLPSFQLLEIQWFLQRILGMAGAADIDRPAYLDSDSDSDSDEEIPNLDLDEVRDSSLLSVVPPSPEVLRKDPHLPDHSKHHKEGAEGNGVGATEGARDMIM